MGSESKIVFDSGKPSKSKKASKAARKSKSKVDSDKVVATASSAINDKTEFKCKDDSPTLHSVESAAKDTIKAPGKTASEWKENYPALDKGKSAAKDTVRKVPVKTVFDIMEDSPAVIRNTRAQEFGKFLWEILYKSVEFKRVDESLAIRTKKDIKADNKPESSKRRAAKDKAVDDGSETVRPSKREDNTTHDDKTVSLNEYWKEKAAKMNIPVEEGANVTPQVPDSTEQPYEGSVQGIPPLPAQYVTEFLMNNKPDCKKALVWCKAQAVKDFAEGTGMTWDGKSETSEGYNNDEAEVEHKPEESVNPVALKMDEKLAKKQARRRRLKANAKANAKARKAKAAEEAAAAAAEESGSAAKDAPAMTASRLVKGKFPARRSPPMDHEAVRRALEDAKFMDEKAEKECIFGKDIPEHLPQEVRERILKDREFHASVIRSMDEAHDELRKTMFGNNPPKPKARAPDVFEGEVRPPNGFASLEKELRYHAHLASRVAKAQDKLNRNIKKEMKRRGNAGRSGPEPMGLRKTPAVADEMTSRREIHPESMARVQAASVRLHKAMFGDAGPSEAKFNDKEI
ncbi:hypothetical protein PHISCL_09409 [Aspergillus sclerotialis]|uniref:Uncharacterized protein n=1 Tax=Aspergillus sclerotialis TaxID=2070753 RepID=A0A3A2ZG15_9EURO|nr:hypothetical protein PHISCL_09409 [Aspergillus sclerotialis]